MKFGLEDHIIEQIAHVLEEQPKVDKAYIFGSRAKGNYRPDSDIDIAVKGFELSVEDILRMSAAMDKPGIGYAVDLVDYDSIKEEALREHVDRVGVEIYSRWKKQKIGDIVTLEYGKSLANYQADGGKYDVFGTNGKIGTTETYLYDKPSIIIGRKGAYRETHLSESPFFVIDTAFYTKNKINELDTIFLYYWFKKIDINEMDSGSAIPSTSRDEVYDLDIYLPRLSEQTEIARILKNLDNKIDLLHRQNKTLETMAEALFRQWFIVDQKDSNSIKVSDVAEINPDTISGSYPYSVIEYLDTGSITKGIIEQYQEYSLSEAPSRAQRIVKKDDIVYSLVRPIQRHYGILDSIKQNTIVSTGFCVIRCKELWTHFIYLLLTLDENVEYFDMVAEGSTSAYPSLRPSDISNFEFALPDQEKLKQFSKISIDTWRKIMANKNQIANLTAARDALLPKLLSGEVRVKMP